MAIKYDVVAYHYDNEKYRQVIARGLSLDSLIKRVQYHNSKNVTGNTFFSGESSIATPRKIEIVRGYKDIHLHETVLA